MFSIIFYFIDFGSNLYYFLPLSFVMYLYLMHFYLHNYIISYIYFFGWILMSFPFNVIPFNLKDFLQCFLKGQSTSHKLPQTSFNLEYIFNLPSLLKNSFDGYKILNCHNLFFSSFFFSTVNMLSLCSLTDFNCF